VIDLIKNISTNLKKLRKQKGWSLDIASLNTKVSKAMLGQIERGESVPTIATLWKIAKGFDVSFSSFMEGIESYSESLVHRKVELKPFRKESDKIKVMPIFPFDEHLGFEVFIIEILPNFTHFSSPHQQGVVEHIIPVIGSIDVFFEGKWHSVRQNEGLRFDASLPHGYRNTSNHPSLFHNMIHYKKGII
jgi:transcriptional regulator with XRE-family HTH domain